MCVANISAHFDEMVENYIYTCTFTWACMYAGTLVAMDKMAPVVAAQARRRSVCRRLLRLSRKICLMFPAATVFNLGENQFIYVSDTHSKLNIGRFKARFCVAMARLRRIPFSADLCCIAKYVIEWGSSKRGDKTGRSCSFLEMNE